MISFKHFKNFCKFNKNNIIDTYNYATESPEYYSIDLYSIRYFNGKQYCGIDIDKVYTENCSPYMAVLKIMEYLHSNGIPNFFNKILETVVDICKNNNNYTPERIDICEHIVEYMFTNDELWIEKYRHAKTICI